MRVICTRHTGIWGSDNVSVIDGLGLINSVIATIPVGVVPSGIGINP